MSSAVASPLPLPRWRADGHNCALKKPEIPQSGMDNATEFVPASTKYFSFSAFRLRTWGARATTKLLGT